VRQPSPQRMKTPSYDDYSVEYTIMVVTSGIEAKYIRGVAYMSNGEDIMANAQEFALHVEGNEFKEKILQAELPALVDFWAPWCYPCRVVAPIIEELARSYHGRVIVAKVNTDRNADLANSYGIQGIPTMLFIKRGEVVDRVVGAVSKQILAGKLKKLLAGEPATGKSA